MPFATVSTSTGQTSFHYTISTPSSASAESIEPELPVLLFFHALGYHNIFHSQFCNRTLRKFNLVTFDLRWHGYTTSDTLPPKYGQEEAAEDVIAMIDTLQLPACHFVALDMGSTIALQVAVQKPEQVLSLFIISHTCLEELPDIVEGRVELLQAWTSGLPEAQAEAGLAFTQYAFSNDMSPLAQALQKSCLAICARKWSPEECRLIAFEFLRTRKPQSLESLSRISCPVKLIHGGGSIIYAPSYSDKLMQDLQKAGVKTTMEIIPYAPHYLCVDFGKELNPMIHDFVVASLPKKGGAPVVPSTPPEIVVSPWDRMLRDYGWDPLRRHELDDDDFVVSYPYDIEISTG
ncbi:Alpha/Beta hydrolase protein [Lentinula raphanica]|nr:Alpha/Beta hydrolase protein [Lentinula raphanica]